MQTYRESLRDVLRELKERCEYLQQCSYEGFVRSDCMLIETDENLVLWLTDERFEKGGRVEKGLAKIQKNLDELRKLLTMYKERENGKTA